MRLIRILLVVGGRWLLSSGFSRGARKLAQIPQLSKKDNNAFSLCNCNHGTSIRNRYQLTLSTKARTNEKKSRSVFIFVGI